MGGWLDGLTASSGLDILRGAASDLININQSEINREFQRSMSNTAHQREVEDLKKAGLNPILSALKGGGASTPAGAMATSSGSSHIAADANSARALKIQQQQADQAKQQVENQTAATAAEIALKQSQKANVDADTVIKALGPDLSRAQIEKILSDIGVNKAQVANLGSSARAYEAQAKLTTAEAAKATVEAKIWNKINPYVDQLLDWVVKKGTAASSITAEDVKKKLIEWAPLNVIGGIGARELGGLVDWLKNQGAASSTLSNKALR